MGAGTTLLRSPTPTNDPQALTPRWPSSSGAKHTLGKTPTVLPAYRLQGAIRVAKVDEFHRRLEVAAWGTYERSRRIRDRCVLTPLQALA